MLFFLIILTIAVLFFAFVLSVNSVEPVFNVLATAAVLLNCWLIGGVIFVVVHFLTKYW